MQLTPLTWPDVRRLALALEGSNESSEFNTQAVKVGHKMFVRLHQDEETVVVRMPKPVRAKWLRERPDDFFVTPVYEGFPYVLVRLASVTETDLKSVLEIGWREVR